MQTSRFKAVLEAMNPTQQSALEELEKVHSELMWDGGKVDTRPLRVSIKNMDGKSMAAINTREKDTFLRLEFRSIDYNGYHGFPTQHRNFDKAYDLFGYSNVAIASEIISVIKQKYIALVDNPKIKDKKEEYYKPKEDVQLSCKEKSTSHDEYVIIKCDGLACWRVRERDILEENTGHAESRKNFLAHAITADKAVNGTKYLQRGG